MTTAGRETATACDASTSVVREPARRAIHRSAAGGMFLSAVAISAQDGIVLNDASPAFASRATVDT